MYHTQTEKWYLKTGMWKLDVPPNQIVMVDERLSQDGELSRTLFRVHVYDTLVTRDACKSLEPMEEEGEKVLCSHCCVVQHS